jgi:hypothetical protein
MNSGCGCGICIGLFLGLGLKKRVGGVGAVCRFEGRGLRLEVGERRGEGCVGEGISNSLMGGFFCLQICCCIERWCFWRTMLV